MFGSRRTTHRTAASTTTSTHAPKRSSRFGFGRSSGGTFRQNRARGLQSSLNNPNTTSTGRASAKAQLKGMGQKPNKTSFGTRVRRLFGMGGRSHHHRRNANAPLRSY